MPPGLLPLHRKWEEGVIHGHRGGRVSQGAMDALQAWDACSGSQDEHTKNMHRAADSTGFDTCFYIHTLQTSHKGTTQYKYSISLGYTSSSMDKSVIMITAGKHGIQSTQE